MDIKPPKVNIKDMIKKGYFKIGETFFDKNSIFNYKLTKDGKLENLSIHKMAAKALNKTSQNGWEYWYVLRDGKPKSINEIRKEYWKKELHYQEVAV
ncbi:MAG: hypothetical protein GXO62_04410 [Epsilonproteobacteria bacterium]|nr:hypothetical protein [Campylobacterota bacterium]